MATYREGNRGSGVADLQNQLRSAGYDIAADGIYGPKTAAAVRDFQSKSGLTVDAIAGNQTMGALRNRSSFPQPAQQQAPQYGNYSMPEFSYNPKKDRALQQDIAATNQAVMEAANERGILYGTGTSESMARSTIGLTAQYRQRAFDRYQAKVNTRRAEIDDAMNRINTLGYADNYAASILGIAPGTPSYQAQRDADQRKQQLRMLEMEYEFRRRYEDADNSGEPIIVPLPSPNMPPYQTGTNTPNTLPGGYPQWRP
jgi:hypothetical protein